MHVIGSALMLLWLLIGAFAAGQRHEYNGVVNCSTAGTIVVTVVAGPLNYAGVDPKISCHTPQPSK